LKDTRVTATPSDIRRYKTNYLTERDGIALYRELAKADTDPKRAEIFEKLAAAEEHHAARWAKLLEDNGVAVPAYRASARVRVLGWLSRNVGTQHVLPVIRGMESHNQNAYSGQVEAAGFPAVERSHGRALQLMVQQGEGAGAQSIVKAEGWHSQRYGGSLRAAVFGVNDGLISNFGLVMGVAGAMVEPRLVTAAGVAGMLAGAFSMAAGEYVSVRSQRELYEQQLALEAQELEASPEEEIEELALIYQTKGIPSDQAMDLARRILSNPETGIGTLAREELGLDPSALDSPWNAAISSFVAFAIGAAIPLIPFLAFPGAGAPRVSAAVCGAALFAVGALISIFTGRNMAYSGLRMVAIGALAAAVTFGVGRLFGISVAG
jgi:VIT1/CCC1 family predicted Fe2+/Mn2+ transporter